MRKQKERRELEARKLAAEEEEARKRNVEAAKRQQAITEAEAIAKQYAQNALKEHIQELADDEELLKVTKALETQAQSLAVPEDGEGHSREIEKPPDQNTVEQDLERIFGPGASSLIIDHNVEQDIPAGGMEGDPENPGSFSEWKVVRGKKRNKTQSEGASYSQQQIEELVDSDEVVVKDGEGAISVSGEVSSGSDENLEEMENKKLRMEEDSSKSTLGEVHDSDSANM